MLPLAELGKDAGLFAETLKTPDGALKRLPFSYPNDRHKKGAER